MRPSATTLPILLATMLTLPAQAGVEIVMKSEIDIPGARMKIMGKDFSQSEQRFLVDDAATLKGTVSGNSTNWIDLKREAFFDETKRGCTVTTFAEMEERLKSMQGEESPFKFMGGEDEPPRDPQEFDVRFDTRVGPPVTVAGLKGTTTVVEVEVVDKQSGDVVSKIDIDNVYSSSKELMRLQEFDRKLAERQLRAMNAALGMDFDAMRGRIMGRPEMHKALEEMRKAGIGKDQAVVKTVTRITGTRPPAREGQGDASATSADSAASEGEEPKKRGRLAQRMMERMRNRKGRTPEATTRSEEASGEMPPMSFSSELQSFRSGVDVALPQTCVEAYNKKKR